MPLRCIDSASGGVIHAFDLSAGDWQSLLAENRRKRHLKMPCCCAEVTLRRSSRGTQFFAHKAIGECTTAPETETHLRLKAIAVQTAREHGWAAETEVNGVTPFGESWTADVLATKERARVAVEIQWSGQTEAETVRRQRRYATSGVRSLWLMRRLAAPISESVPAVRISCVEGRYMAHLPTQSNDQVLGVEDFLSAALSGRLKFGLPIGARTVLSAVLGSAPCWRCGAFTRIVTNLNVRVGPHEFDFSVADTEAYSDLFKPIYRRLEAQHKIGPIKSRFSRTQRRSYLSNGCAHCDALFGQFHEHEEVEEHETVTVAELPLNARWRSALLECEEELGWGVFDFASSSAAEHI